MQSSTTPFAMLPTGRRLAAASSPTSITAVVNARAAMVIRSTAYPGAAPHFAYPTVQLAHMRRSQLAREVRLRGAKARASEEWQELRDRLWRLAGNRFSIRDLGHELGLEGEGWEYDRQIWAQPWEGDERLITEAKAPVCLSGVTDDWPGRRRWSPFSKLEEELWDAVVPIQRASELRGYYGKWSKVVPELRLGELGNWLSLQVGSGGSGGVERGVIARCIARERPACRTLPPPPPSNFANPA